MWERTGPCHCSHHILFRVKMFCQGNLRHSGAGQRLGFGHVQEVSEDLSQTVVIGNSVCCHVICFYVVTVKKFPIRGCKGESNDSSLQ